jgi:LmbE family N-acetylglucosaminyl deacetylase
MKIVLVVAAHSDDEVLGCAGTIAKYVASGDKVHVLFMTDGISSRHVANHKVVERERQNSAQKAAAILGTTSIQILNFPDNKMDSVPLLDITQVIEEIILKIQPEIIYTHHVGDLNVDHQITSKAVMTACRPQPNFCVKEIYSFEILSSTEWQISGYLPFTPNVFIDISDYIDVKKMALKAYEDEMHNPPHSRSIENSLRLSSIRGNEVGIDFAEAFTLIRRIEK